jgi:dipeptidyl aminopeptidase/acylaminoacyl peptidase
MTPEMARANDPSVHVDAISSPVLVIHGDKDYRVPIGEGLRLWFELNARVKDPAASPHRFLYFPDENHWILTPQHSSVWYRCVLSFLGVHVLGEDEVVDELLR